MHRMRVASQSVLPARIPAGGQRRRPMPGDRIPPPITNRPQQPAVPATDSAAPGADAPLQGTGGLDSPGDLQRRAGGAVARALPGAVGVQVPVTALSRAEQAERIAAILLPDAALIERAKVDTEAFGVLYERYVRTVYAFAFGKLRDQALAEDITSQTFLKALRALPMYQQRGVPIRSWFFRIAANLIADMHRAPIEEVPLGPSEHETERRDEHHEPADPRAEAAIFDWERAEDFLRLLEDLTPEQQTVLRLRFAGQLTIAEIAGQMARSEGSVKMLLLRGLQALRRRVPAAWSEGR